MKNKILSLVENIIKPPVFMESVYPFGDEEPSASFVEQLKSNTPNLGEPRALNPRGIIMDEKPEPTENRSSGENNFLLDLSLARLGILKPFNPLKLGYTAHREEATSSVESNPKPLTITQRFLRLFGRNTQ